MPANERETHPPTQFVLPRPGGAPAPGSAGTDRVATHLVERSVRRLEIVCVAAILSLLVLWLFVNTLLGTLGDEFASPHQWVPPVAALVASILMLSAAKSGRYSPATLVRVGLVYEVVISFAVTCGSQLGAFQGLAAADVRIDRVGLSYVAPWTLFFSVLVPARPREVLLALIVSVSAVPIVYLVQARFGLAPALPVLQFLPIFVVPYAASAVLAYLAARIVHELGVEVRRAHEMGSYRLEEMLGRGGMGEVWRASHDKLARPAAVKLIRRDALGTVGNLQTTAIARFEREAQVIASLQSPHTVELYDFGTTADGTLYYAMELLDGVDLNTLVRRFGPLPPERVVHLLRQACASLAEAHRRGVVHRDIKPANIQLCRRGIEHDVIKVLDFGLVKQLPGASMADSTLTSTNAIAGTPHYMAPEIALGRAEADGRADLYSLGCVAYWLLTGRHVFDADNPTAAIVAHVQTPPAAPSLFSEMQIPEALDRLVLDCLAKDPSARPRNPEALADRLAAIPFAAPWSEESAARWWEIHRPSATPWYPAAAAEVPAEGERGRR